MSINKHIIAIPYNKFTVSTFNDQSSDTDKFKSNIGAFGNFIYHRLIMI